MFENLTRQEKRAMDRGAGSASASSSGNKVWLSMLGIIVLVVGVGAGLAFLGKGRVQPAVVGDIRPIGQDDQVIGKPDGAVVIVEYSDFQCPACRSYATVLRELKKEMGDEFTLAYRHFPLPYHQNAELAARAAEAAGRQGKFWEMHDRLFVEQDKWAKVADPVAIFSDYARGLGLIPSKFSTDINSASVIDKVKRDRDEATAVGVPGTPTFFVNGQMINNPRSKEEFVALIKEAASQKQNVDQAQNQQN